MKIALDYDDTYTRDPVLWQTFISLAEARGHDIRIVTMRNERGCEEVLRNMGGCIPVIGTNMTPKRIVCREVGWMPDVWIDDTPEFIVE